MLMKLLYHLVALQLPFSPFLPSFSPPLTRDTLPRCQSRRSLVAGMQAVGRLGFSKVTISPLVILHARRSSERCSVGQSAHEIGQVMMGVVLKCVANRERGVLWNRQSILRGKLRANVTTRVAGNQRVILKPQH